MRQKLLDSIKKHVESEYPNEACGFIVDTGKTQKYIPCKNMSDNPTEHFLISPDEQLDAEKQGEIIMVVHSHPDTPILVPSEFDRIQCDHSGIEWGIMSYPDGDFCTISPRINRDYTGRPWLIGYADCWALIMDYHKREHGINLKNYSVDREWWESGKEKLYDDNWQAEGFIEVSLEEMKTGDVIMMRIGASVTNHAAIYVGDNLILHHLYGQLSSRTPYGKYFRDRTVRIVRHKDLFNAQ
ncbi:C40 family peptidase [Gilliamella sp. B3482]|uniref:C40 family peptidase n=1 Tax=Gilliamella sp. B3482 TaxID=2817991 RepID=UPI00226A546E|nr:C40 family peptidase [Gilliamella sp. B3482]MCX8581565.1 C40 family peptidase [Gilliamella sp. B3482]